MAQGDPDAALPVLRRAINLDHGYTLRAAGDDVFRQHLRSVDAFLEALRSENARTLQPVARGRLAELAPLVAKSAELAGHGTVRRLTKVAEAASGMGLMDLWEFEKDFEKDTEKLSAFICSLKKFRRELHYVSVDRDVEEPYDVQETYSENFVIRLADLFRKEASGTARKVRTVRKTRTVRRPIREQRYVLVNGFGDVSSNRAEEWIWVRPGAFTMSGQPYLPPRDVTITRPFLMQATPVTQAQWETIMGYNPSGSPQNADDPVNNVSWFAATAYCDALSRTEGLEEADTIDAPGYRLPTEAEWEYACRAGTTDDRYGNLAGVSHDAQAKAGYPLQDE